MTLKINPYGSKKKRPLAKTTALHRKDNRLFINTLFFYKNNFITTKALILGEKK